MCTRIMVVKDEAHILFKIVTMYHTLQKSIYVIGSTNLSLWFFFAAAMANLRPQKFALFRNLPQISLFFMNQS